MQDRSVEETLKVIEGGKPQDMALGVESLVTHGREAIENLGQAVTAPNALRRWAAIVALGRIGNPAAETALTQALDDEVISVRVAAAQSLLEIGNNTGIPALIDALDSDEVMIGHPPVLVREHAAQVLKHGTGHDLGDSRVAWRQWWEEEGGESQATS